MTREPLQITAGDNLDWSIYDPDYLPADGWTLKYALRGPVALDITSTAAGDSHLIAVAGSITKDYAPGSYSWARYFAKLDGSRTTTATGRITITPDLVLQGAGYDGRSHAEKVLEAIERVIEGRATRGDQELQFDGKKIVKMTVQELIALRQKYRAELRAERNKQLKKSGRATGRTIKFRM